MKTKNFISKVTFLTWSRALTCFEDSFIAICDYRPTDAVEAETVKKLRKECKQLFDVMEEEVGSVENYDIDYLLFATKIEIETKLVEYTKDLMVMDSKIKGFLAERINNKNRKINVPSAYQRAFA